MSQNPKRSHTGLIVVLTLLIVLMIAAKIGRAHV